MSNSKKITWKALGRSYDGNKVSHGEIVITESGGINMEGIESFGLPINARLAVKLISNLWQEIKQRECNSGSEGVNGLQNEMKLIEQIKTYVEKGDKDSVIKMIDDLQKHITYAHYWLDELLMNSFAITFDKSMLLKTLSQPECEGVRFYLCMKEGTQQSVPDQHGVLSLVTVGVDKFGKDLHFDYDVKQHKSGKVEDRSLTEEYGSSPSMLTFNITDKRLEPFVLFKYAMPFKDLTAAINMNGAPEVSQEAPAVNTPIY